MKTSYVSDAADVDADALMDEPFATIGLDLSLLPVEQQVMLAQQLGIDKLDDDEMRAALGAVMTGADEEPWTDLQATLHIDAGRMVTFLNEIGMVDLEPQADPEQELEEITEDDG